MIKPEREQSAKASAGKSADSRLKICAIALLFAVIELLMVAVIGALAYLTLR